MVSVDHVAALFSTYSARLEHLTNDTIATRAGFKSGNIIAMIRRGTMKLPVGRVRPLAAVTGIPERPLLRAALRDRNLEEWEVFRVVFGLADVEDHSSNP